MIRGKMSDLEDEIFDLKEQNLTKEIKSTMAMGT